MIKEYIKRLQEPMPNFFKTLSKVAVAVGSGAMAVVVANSTLNMELNETLISVSKYVFVGALAVYGTCRGTKVNETPFKRIYGEVDNGSK